MATSDEQMKRADDNRRWLKERPPDSNRGVAAWLRELVPGLDKRHRRVAERMAGDFETLARNTEASRSPQP
jgi:hypothetical protein